MVLLPGLWEIEVLDNILIAEAGSVKLPDCLFWEELLLFSFTVITESS